MGENGGNSPDISDTTRTDNIFDVVVVATERVYAGGKGSEGVEDGSESVDREEEKGCA